MDNLSFMHGAVMGENLEETRDVERVLEALENGQTVYLELDWETGRHNVHVNAVAGDRVLYFNPMAEAAEPGQVLENPRRLVHGPNVESFAKDDLSALCAEYNAVFYLPGT